MQTSSANDMSRWGSTVVVEEVLGHPCRVFADRPRHLRELLALGARNDDHTHLVQGEQRVSFAELVAAVSEVAARIRAAGACPGDRVLLAGANSLGWVVTFWACVTSDLVVVPANAWWSADELAHAVRLVDPRLAVADRRRRERMPDGLACLDLETILDGSGPDPEPADAPPRAAERVASEDDPAMVLFTSGTTSFPRGATLSHRALLAALQNLLVSSGRIPGPDDPPRGLGGTLMTMPLFHIGGILQLLTTLISGGKLVFLDGRFSATKVLGLIEHEQIAGWSAVPTMVSRVLDVLEAEPDSFDVSGFRSMTIGGAPVAESLRERVRAALPNVRRRISASYGMTEICGVATGASGAAVLDRPGTVGLPLPAVDLRIQDPDSTGVGEVMVRSAGAMTAYWGEDPDSVFEEGRWLPTGDLGRLDDDGYLYIVGRSKDMVIRGGENIATVQVEHCLLSHPAVADAAVVGLPHPELGEEVAAAVVVCPGSTLDERDLAAYAVERLAYFAVPTVWTFITDLPRNATGKVLKSQVVAGWPDRVPAT